VTALGLVVRWLHLSACVLLVGHAAMLLIAGRARQPTARAWTTRVLALAGILALVALGSGVGTLAWQTAVLEDRPAAALEGSAILRVLLETRGGQVWLVRHALLVLLALFLAMRARAEDRLDWLAARGQAVLLGALALSLVAASGHAAAAGADPALAIAADVLHLLGAGVWLGGLVPLALLLAVASREGGADARPYAVLAARRFSRIALWSVLVLAATGVVSALVQVGDVPGLLGTRYGRLLLGKIAVLLPIIGLAAASRRWLLPSLSGDGPTVGRPAMRRLGASGTVEAGLGLGVLALVAAMTITPPARHVAPTWPLSFRLTTDALAHAPDIAPVVLVGSQIAVLGLVIALCAAVLRAGRLPVAGAAVVLLLVGGAVALPPLSIDAYPTTFMRPAVTWNADSIATGAALYHEHCAACHGPQGAGDGPAGRGLPRPPADLRAGHTAQHTAGDLFWWITHGIPRAGMPGFGGHLDAEQRWDLVNYARALAAAEAARRLGPVVEPGLRGPAAPDFLFGVGPTPARSLRDFRGRRNVLLVIYTLPGSAPRLAQLATHYQTLATHGLEVIAVSSDAAPDAIRRLGPEPPVLFPVVTEGAPAILAAYRLFARGPHTEFLIDRQGYLRARSAGTGQPSELGLLLEGIRTLNDEKATAAVADEHVH
jgi:putative copper resistance protein D